MRIQDIDLRQLQVFVDVVESGGLSRAKLSLGLTVSTLSIHLKNLETRFGAKLAYRGNGGFQLTPAGETIYAAAKQLLASVDAFSAEAGSLHGHVGGTLNLGLSENHVFEHSRYVERLISRFLDEHPAIRITVMVDMPAVLEKKVSEGVLDAAICQSRCKHRSIDYQLLFQRSIGLYVGRTHPFFMLADEDISDEMIRGVRFARNGSAGDFYDGPQRTDNDTALTYNTEATALLVRSGHFIGHLPADYADAWVRQKQMRALKPGETLYHATYFLLSLRERVNRSLEALLRCLREDDDTRLLTQGRSLSRTIA